MEEPKQSIDLNLNDEFDLEVAKDEQIHCLDRVKIPTNVKQKQLIDLNAEIAIDEGAYTLDKLGVPMNIEKRLPIDLNVECSVEISEDVKLDTISETQTFDNLVNTNIGTGILNMSRHVQQETVHNDPFVGSIFGLRYGHTDQGVSNRPDVASYPPRNKLILDFENSMIRLPNVDDDNGYSSFGSDIRDGQIVMDFAHSRVYTFSGKESVINIADPFTKHSQSNFAYQGERHLTHSKKETQKRCRKQVGKTIAYKSSDKHSKVHLSSASHSKREKGTHSPQTYTDRNEINTSSTHLRDPTSNCFLTSFTSEAQHKTSWHSKCLQYFRDIGSITTLGENSSKVSSCDNERAQFRLAKEMLLSNRGKITQSLCLAKPKQNDHNSSWDKRVCILNGSINDDDGVHQNLSSSKSQSQGQITEGVCAMKRKRNNYNSFRDKRMRFRNGFQNYQNGECHNLATSDSYNTGVSDMYVDIGDCRWSCNHCGAKFWYGERLKGYTNTRFPTYSQCCSRGKIVVQQQRDPPSYMKELLKNRRFLENIRAYNQMFAMTSFGAHVDESINNRRGPYVFKISGQIYHWIGSMCPSSGDAPRFLQLYIYDTEHEVVNRMRHFGGVDSHDLDQEIVESLIAFLDQHNELVRIFRTARDKCRDESIPHFKLKLYSCVGSRQHDLPTSETLGAIIFENGPETAMNYDVIIEDRDGFPQRISRLHQSYMSLQFPLLFVYGEPGYSLELKQIAIKDKRLSMNEYYMHQLHERCNLYGLLFRSGRLFQQYVVGVYCCIEKNRIDFYRTRQNDIRKEYLSGVYDAVHKGDRVGSDIGGRLILPRSFTGGPRYMYSHYLDALAICRVLGNPQFFITFTCNVNWPEIKRHMENFPDVTAADRADVVVCVFQQKVHDFCNFLQDSNRFGHVTGFLYTIEFQKRGLPHCHTLLWVTNKIQNAKEVDQYISAELPDPETDPEGYKVISEMMVHGPCGPIHKNAVCMKEDSCSKKFPKKYNKETFFDKNGHVHYRRRETDVHVTRHGAELDNTHVVPYNRELCLTFHAHINVEYCGWSMLIKYLFKYISKGTDRIFAKVTRPTEEMQTETETQRVKVDEL